MKTYNYTQADEKLIERIVSDEHVMINHVMLHTGDALPTHHSDSNVYLLIVRGEMTLALKEEAPKQHKQQSILSIPYQTKMALSNEAEQLLEFFIIKSPHPNNYPKESQKDLN